MECTIQTLGYIIRACIIDYKVNWDNLFILVEFVYINSYHSCISMAPYEALYGRRCGSSNGWFEVGEPSFLGLDLIYRTLDKVHIIRNHLRTAYS